MIEVSMLTYAPDPSQIIGNLPALRTARVGFPNGKIFVTDYVSCPDARDIFKTFCREHDYIYQELPDKLWHAGHLYSFAQNKYDNYDLNNPLVISDPDVIFYKSCEHFFDDCNPDELVIKGMLWPGGNFNPELYQMSRLHTSLLFINKPDIFQERINQIQDMYQSPKAY